MKKSFEFHFDLPFIKRALRRDLLWRGYVAAVLFVLLALMGRWYYRRFDPWLTAVLFGGALFVIWRIHVLLTKVASRVHELWLKQSPRRVVRYELDDEGFDVVMSESRTRYRWQGLRRLWRCHDVWLIEIVRLQSVFFPPDVVPDDVLDFITERCRAAGLRV